MLLYVLADFRLEYQKKQTVDLHLYMKDQRSALFELAECLCLNVKFFLSTVLR